MSEQCCHGARGWVQEACGDRGAFQGGEKKPEEKRLPEGATLHSDLMRWERAALNSPMSSSNVSAQRYAIIVKRKNL